MIIAHPPCTHLSASGNGPRKHKDWGEVRRAIEFARKFILCRSAPRVCVENPRGILSRYVMPPTQEVQPWWFGDPVEKRTALWLRGLEKLSRDVVVEPWDDSLWRMGSGYKDRGHIRSRSFPGMARAMAEQWG
jgi:hypothetical protein